MHSLPTREICIVQSGPLTLVQDRGRFGFQQLGVSVGGAIDTDALNIGNHLVGNNADAAVLEILLGGLEIEIAYPAVFALTGANTNATLDGVPLSTNVSYTAHAGARLSLGMASQGLRAYVAFAGGVDVQSILGSRSTHIASGIGGLDGRPLAEGDVLQIGASSSQAQSGHVFIDDEFISVGSDFGVRVVLGPQDDEFSQAGIETLLNSTYTVSDQSNRQGLRLDGPEIESKSGRYDIVSDAVMNGSIQIPGDGKPIILLADRQPTGGYAKIATVASVDLPKLGQAAPGASITFSAISTVESQKLLVERVSRFEEVELSNLVEPISLRIGDQHVSIGVAENDAFQLADIDGRIYPVSIDEYTPAD